MSTYNNEPKQTMWEMWFITSVVLLLGTLFIGTIEGSVEMFPHFNIWLTIVFINFCVSLGYGIKN